MTETDFKSIDLKVCTIFIRKDNNVKAVTDEMFNNVVTDLK